MISYRVRSQRKVRLESALFGVLGLAAGIVRYFHLSTGFEPADDPEIAGLAIPGNVYGMLITTVSVLVCVYLLLSYAVSRFGSDKAKGDLLVPGRINGKARAFLLASAITAFFGATLQMIDSFARFSVWGILTSGLLFGAGASAVVTARYMGQRARGENIGPPNVLLAVFWACAWLVDLYQSVSRKPTLLQYVFPVLGVITLVLVFYVSAGYVFARAKLPAVLCAMKALLFFGPMNIVGEGLYAWKEGILFTRAGLFSVVRPGVFLLYGVFFAIGILCLLRPNLVAASTDSQAEEPLAISAEEPQVEPDIKSEPEA